MKKPRWVRIIQEITGILALIPIWFIARYLEGIDVNWWQDAGIAAQDIIIYTRDTSIIGVISFLIAMVMIYGFAQTLVLRHYSIDRQTLFDLKSRPWLQVFVIAFFLGALATGIVSSQHGGIIVTEQNITEDRVFKTETIGWDKIGQISLKVEADWGNFPLYFIASPPGNIDPNMILHTHDGKRIFLWGTPVRFLDGLVEQADSPRIIEIAKARNIPVCVESGSHDWIREVFEETAYEEYEDVLETFDTAAPISDCDRNEYYNKLSVDRPWPVHVKILIWTLVITTIIFIAWSFAPDKSSFAKLVDRWFYVLISIVFLALFILFITF